MTNTRQKIDEYNLLKPSRFDLVTSFELTQPILEQGFDLEVTIHLACSRDVEIEKEELILTFVGVRNRSLPKKGPRFKGGWRSETYQTGSGTESSTRSTISRIEASHFFVAIFQRPFGK
jgi:hypothetical protein